MEPRAVGSISREERRKEVLAHCLLFLERDPEYAMYAADWYEKNEPWSLDGLGQRVRREVEKARLRERADGQPS